MREPIFRIVSKIDGKINVEEVSSKKKFVLDDMNSLVCINEQKKLYKFSDSIKKAGEELSNDISTLVAFSIMANSPDPSAKLNGMYRLGLMFEQIEKKHSLTKLQIVELFQEASKSFMERSINDLGVGFREPHRVPENLRAKNEENLVKKDDGYTCSIGDMIKSKRAGGA